MNVSHKKCFFANKEVANEALLLASLATYKFLHFHPFIISTLAIANNTNRYSNDPADHGYEQFTTKYNRQTKYSEHS